MSTPIKISFPIVSFSFRSAEAANDQPVPTPVAPFVDPRFVRIARREEGSWESVTVKCSLPTPNGTDKLYFVIGFGKVCGNNEGEDCIERPLEFFIPQTEEGVAQQWISATMRSISLAARGGFIAKALDDLRSVKGDPFFWGKTKSGKGINHPSVVSAIAWAMQEELRKRGYFNDDYEERPLDELVARYKRRHSETEPLPVDHPTVSFEAPTTTPKAEPGYRVVSKCTQKQCSGDMVMKDGCPTCLDCGYSKCG